MSRFAIDTVSIHDDGGSQVTVRSLQSASHRLSRTTTGPESGHTYDEARFILDSDDAFSWATLALSTMLDNVSPVQGVCVEEGDTEFGLRLFGQLLSRCGTAGRGGSGTHAQITAAKSHIFIRQITASPNQPAVMTLEAINLSDDGANDPSVTVYNASLPGSYVIDEAFKLGPVSVGGITLDPEELTTVTIDTNINTQVVRDEVTGYATDLLLLKSQPTVRINAQSGEILQASKIPHVGKACAHANTSIGLIKFDPAGIAVPLATAAHIELTFAGKAFVEDHLSGGGAAAAGSSLLIETIESSGVPIIATTGTALA